MRQKSDGGFLEQCQSKMSPFQFTSDFPSVNEMCVEIDAVLLCSGVELMSGAMCFSANHDPKMAAKLGLSFKTPAHHGFERGLDVAAEFSQIVGNNLSLNNDPTYVDALDSVSPLLRSCPLSGKAEGDMMV